MECYMNRLYIHVGTHKTGTTTIQHSLRANDELLKDKYNLYYPDISIVSKFSHYAHHEISHALAGNSKKIDDAQLKDFFGELSKELEFRDVILSAEPIYRHYLNDVQGDIWDKKKAYYSKLSQFLPKTCEVVLILYIRQPDKFAASMYSEKVSATNYNEDFVKFLHDFNYHFDYEKNIEVLKECISNKVIVKPFDRQQFVNKDLLSDFYSIFDIDDNELKDIENKNDGLSRSFVEIKRIFNKCGYSRKDLNVLRSYLSHLASSGQVFYTPENSFFTEHTARGYNNKRYYPYPQSYLNYSDEAYYVPSITMFIHVLILVKKNIKEFSSLDLVDITQKYLDTFDTNNSISINDILFITELVPKCVSKGNKREFYEYGKFLVANGLEKISVIIFHELFYNRKLTYVINDLISNYSQLKDNRAIIDISKMYEDSESIDKHSKNIISSL